MPPTEVHMFMGSHLSLPLLLGHCIIKGLAGGRAVLECEAGSIRHCQGCAGGLNGHSMPYLHWLCLQAHTDTWQVSHAGAAHLDTVCGVCFLLPEQSYRTVHYKTHLPCSRGIRWLPVSYPFVGSSWHVSHCSKAPCQLCCPIVQLCKERVQSSADLESSLDLALLLFLLQVLLLGGLCMLVQSITWQLEGLRHLHTSLLQLSSHPTS